MDCQKVCKNSCAGDWITRKNQRVILAESLSRNGVTDLLLEESAAMVSEVVADVARLQVIAHSVL